MVPVDSEGSGPFLFNERRHDTSHANDASLQERTEQDSGGQAQRKE
jgi:hypothetical protein